MTQLTADTLEKLGRKVARQVVGATVRVDVEVTASEDSAERPVYIFSFLIEPDRDRQRAGLFRTRLGQRLRDELTLRGEARYPIVRLLSRSDWQRRARA